MNTSHVKFHEAALVLVDWEDGCRCVALDVVCEALNVAGSFFFMRIWVVAALACGAA